MKSITADCGRTVKHSAKPITQQYKRKFYGVPILPNSVEKKHLTVPIAGNNGFTLIEIVLTLIIMSIFATLFFQMITTAVEQSSQPVVSIQQELALTEIIEKMTADYKWVLMTDQTPLATFKTRIENGNTPGNTPYFGPYDISTKYIEFSSNGTNLEEATAACTTDCKVLKVTISQKELHLTTLFTN